MQMKEIQTITKKLRKIYDSFAQVINSGDFVNVRPDKAIKFAEHVTHSKTEDKVSMETADVS